MKKENDYLLTAIHYLDSAIMSLSEADKMEKLKVVSAIIGSYCKKKGDKKNYIAFKRLSKLFEKQESFEIKKIIKKELKLGRLIKCKKCKIIYSVYLNKEKCPHKSK